MKILVVDDVANVRLAMAAVLRRAGHNVLVAENGVVALETLNEHPKIELVFLDLEMPKKNGLETILALRKTHPSLPVVLCSGSFRSLRYQEVRLHTQATLEKPFGRQDILNVVDLFLK